MNYTPSELATTQDSFERWAGAALVETIPIEERYDDVPSESRKLIDTLKHLELPKALKVRSSDIYPFLQLGKISILRSVSYRPEMTTMKKL